MLNCKKGLPSKEAFKGIARRLGAYLNDSKQLAWKHSQVLEALSVAYGFKDWNTLSSKLVSETVALNTSVVESEPTSSLENWTLTRSDADWHSSVVYSPVEDVAALNWHQRIVFTAMENSTIQLSILKKYTAEEFIGTTCLKEAIDEGNLNLYSDSFDGRGILTVNVFKCLSVESIVKVLVSTFSSSETNAGAEFFRRRAETALTSWIVDRYGKTAVWDLKSLCARLYADADYEVEGEPLFSVCGGLVGRLARWLQEVNGLKSAGLMFSTSEEALSLKDLLLTKRQVVVLFNSLDMASDIAYTLLCEALVAHLAEDSFKGLFSANYGCISLGLDAVIPSSIQKLLEDKVRFGDIACHCSVPNFLLVADTPTKEGYFVRKVFDHVLVEELAARVSNYVWNFTAKTDEFVLVHRSKDRIEILPLEGS
jgi:hypothetical protein